MSLTLHTAAALLPLTPAEAKLQCRALDLSIEDPLFVRIIGAATEDAEHLMQRAVMPQKHQLTLDAFASSIELRMPPITAIDSVKYVDATTGTLTTLPDTEYQLVGAKEHVPRLVAAYGKTWPATRAQPEAVQIVFSCGYADAAAVPNLIKAWIALRIGALYANRDAWTLGQKIEFNESVDYMLDRFRSFTL